MSALLRAVLGLMAETAVWAGLVIGVAAVVSLVVMAAFGTARHPRHVVAVGSLAAALAVGIADRVGLPAWWQIGLNPRRVPVVWAVAGAAIGAAAACLAGRRRRES